MTFNTISIENLRAHPKFTECTLDAIDYNLRKEPLGSWALRPSTSHSEKMTLVFHTRVLSDFGYKSMTKNRRFSVTDGNLVLDNGTKFSSLEELVADTTATSRKFANNEQWYNHWNCDFGGLTPRTLSSIPNIPNGSWFIQYNSSTSSGLFVLVVNSELIVKGVRILPDGYQIEETEEVHATVEELANFIPEATTPLSSYLSSLYEENQLDVHHIRCKNLPISCEEFTNKLRQPWIDLGWESICPIQYNEQIDRTVIYLTIHQIKCLGFYFGDIFSKSFGYGYQDEKTIFDGYEIEKWALVPEKVRHPFACARNLFQKNIRRELDTMTAKPVLTTNPEEFQEPLDTILHWLGQDVCKGVHIGEVHQHKSPKLLIKNHMKELKEAGVDTLFLEFLPYKSTRVALEAYSNAPHKPMPPQLMATLLAQDICCVGKDQIGLVEIVENAVKEGIRVVGLESSNTEIILGGYGDTTDKTIMRSTMFNWTAGKIIEKEKGAGKYLSLMGNTHTSLSSGNPGLSEITGQPNILVFDKEKPSSKPNHFHLLNSRNREIPSGFNKEKVFVGLDGTYHAIHHVEVASN